MGVRSNIYTGQPGATIGTLASATASQVITVIKATAHNPTANVETLDFWITDSGVSGTDANKILSNFTVQPGETREVFDLTGQVLGNAQVLRALASTASAVTVRLSGYTVTTP